MKKINHIVYISIFMACICTIASAQNQPSFDQYHFNQLVINPAYAGSKGNIEVNAFLHQQWNKLDGAPATQSVTIHAPLANNKIGLGAKMLHDNIGITNRYEFAIDYAYRMHTNVGVFAAGIEGNISNYNLDYAKLDAYQNGDPAFVNQAQSFWSPNAGAGIWFNNDHLYAGISAPILIEKNPDSTVSNELNLYEEKRHYYASAGYLINITQNFAVKPYGLVKYLPDATVQVDGSLSLIFANTFWIGGSYKSNKTISIMAEYFVNAKKTLKTNQFAFGYSYNFSTTTTQAYFGPTHEVFIAYNFYKNQTNIQSPRFF